MKIRQRKSNTSENPLMERRDTKPLTYRLMDDEYDTVNHFITLTSNYPSTYVLPDTYLYEEVLDFIDSFDNSTTEWEFNDNNMSSVHRIVIGSNVIFGKLMNTINVSAKNLNITKQQHVKYVANGQAMIIPGIYILYELSFDGIQDFIDKISNMRLSSNTKHNSINLICKNSNGLYIKEYPLAHESQYDFDLNLHYGDGFDIFHNATVKRIDESVKGIILFHGVSGTGKSFYIRRLMRDLARNKKKILYLPNNMIDMLGTPDFNDFLLEWTDDVDVQNGILIVVEDAERVLVSRDVNVYGSDGVSNILNSTDGILNDFFGIQVLATFNTDIKNIDKAILRKKRATAVREFKLLSITESQRLIDHIGIDYKAEHDMSLADIYSIADEFNDVLLNFKSTSKKIGF